MIIPATSPTTASTSPCAPRTLNDSSIIYVVEDEVTYRTGGRWGQWSSGGGSSLELIDPRSNHRLAANWTDSDDTKKSVWANIEATGVMDNGSTYGAAFSYAQIGQLDAGECLVDGVEVPWARPERISSRIQVSRAVWIIGRYRVACLVPPWRPAAIPARIPFTFAVAAESGPGLIPARRT